MAIDNTVVGDEADLWPTEEKEDEELNKLDDQEFVEQEEETNLATSMEDRLSKLITMPWRMTALEDLTMDFDVAAKAEEDRNRSEEFRQLMEATAAIVLPDNSVNIVTDVDQGAGMEAVDGLRATIAQKMKELWQWLVKVLKSVKEFLFNRISRTRKRLAYVKLLLKANRVGGKTGVITYPASILQLAKSTNLATNPAWVVTNLKDGLAFFKSVKLGYAEMGTQLAAIGTTATREGMLSLVATSTDKFRQLVSADTTIVKNRYQSPLLPGNKIVVITTGKTFDDYDFLITHAAVRVPASITQRQVKVDRSLIDQVISVSETVMSDIEKDFQNMESLTNEFKKAIDTQKNNLDDRSRTNMDTMACFSWYARIQKRTVNSSLQYLLRLTDAGLDFAAAALR